MKHQKRGRLGLNNASGVRLCLQSANDVWTYDFMTARTHDRRNFRDLTIVDEYTRECLSIDVARQLESHDVFERLARFLVCVVFQSTFAVMTD